MHDIRRVLPVLRWLLPLTVAVGCSDGTAPREDFRFAGNWAGVTWVGDAEALFVSGTTTTDTLYVFGIRPVNAGQYPEEQISVRVPFAGVGTYALAGNAVEFVVLTGGDVISAHYNGHGHTAGTLAVESYDATMGIITGAIAFKAHTTSGYQPYGPAAGFDGGRFRARVRRTQ